MIFNRKCLLKLNLVQKPSIAYCYIYKKKKSDIVHLLTFSLHENIAIILSILSTPPYTYYIDQQPWAYQLYLGDFV